MHKRNQGSFGLINSVVLSAALVAVGPGSALAAGSTPLAEVQSVVHAAISTGAMPGAIVIASVNGKVVVSDAEGVYMKSDFRLKPDTVVWLASMSKPITAVAIMMLVEEGKVRLDDPVSRYIPTFAAGEQVRVPIGAAPVASAGPPAGGATAGPAMQYRLVPATRPITVGDLLTHTSGLQSIGVPNPAVPQIGATDTLASWVPRLSAVPLDFQPGSRWAYSNAVGFDVLSRIVEVASGKPFNDFLIERIFRPLKMHDTGFRGQRSDLAGRMTPLQGPLANDERLIGSKFFSGAAGLYGTLEDYRKFAEMLGNGGTYRGHRLLKASSVSMLSTNQVGNLFHTFNNKPDVHGLGFGLSVAIVLDPAVAGLSVPRGSYGWDGAGGTRFWVSPAQHRVIILFVPDAGVRAQIETVLDQRLSVH